MSDTKSQFYRWLNLRRVYRAVFERENREPRIVKTMLDDLREFCRADTSCVIIGANGQVDTHATLLAEGRREVWLRIQSILTLSDEALNRMKEIENDN
jgi:hypothetical protein